MITHSRLDAAWRTAGISLLLMMLPQWILAAQSSGQTSDSGGFEMHEIEKQDKAVESVDRDGATNLCDATKRAGVRRFVLLSSIYAGRPESGPENLRKYLHAKHAADVYVMSSDLDFTILRPGYLTDDPATGAIEIGDAFEGSDVQISRADVAEVIAVSITEPKAIGAVFEFINGDTPIADALARLR